jgi:peptidoglycan/LPS O-acetylase OafA/YrhL
MSETRASHVNPKGRMIGLDALRSAALLIVLANHCFLGIILHSGIAKWEGLLKYLSAASILSIEWLFVLSGYLIGGLLIRDLDRHRHWSGAVRTFLLRRWMRTFPLYFVWLALNAALVYAGIAKGAFSWSYALFSQNLIYPEPTPLFFGESWSLAMDEWFYALLPIGSAAGIALLRLSAFRSIVFIVALLIAIPTLARFLAPVPTDFFSWDAAIRRLTLFHIDATAWGVVAALIAHRWPQCLRAPSPHRALMLGLAAMSIGMAMVMLVTAGAWPSGFFGRLQNMVSLALISIGTLLCLPVLIEQKIETHLLRKSILWISDHSYSIYLCHFPLLFIFVWALKLGAQATIGHVLLTIGVWLLAVGIVSAFTYHFIELPMNALRNRVTSPTPAPAEPAR